MVLLPLGGGCNVGYVTKQSIAHTHVLSARKSVDKAIAQGKIPDAWLPQLETIEQARRFGAEALELPTEDLYRKISLVRPDPNWVVSASAKDALEPITWWFPVAGRVGYRGYYGREDADRFAKRLADKGLDVLVRPSDAFSSLGWFSDPIRPAMLDRRDSSLVDLVLHEAAHRLLYIKGHTDFNESFATFVGDVGTARFFEAREGHACPTCREIEARAEDSLQFSDFIEVLAAELQELYSQPISREEKILKREDVFARTRQRYEETDWRSRGFDWFLNAELDNAVVLSIRRYDADKDLFERVLERCGGDLVRSIRFIESLNWRGMPKKDRRATTPKELLARRLDEDRPCPPAKPR